MIKVSPELRVAGNRRRVSFLFLSHLKTLALKNAWVWLLEYSIWSQQLSIPKCSSHGSEIPAEASTPRRGVQSQPTTPHRMNQNRTPQAYTPSRMPPTSSPYRLFPRVHTKPPDFQALAKEQNSLYKTGSKRSSSDHFIAYNPEKEPIKVHTKENR